jgi:hypothetical protein
MALVINATEETIAMQLAGGNWFTWKPGQRKTIRDERIARFIETERRGYGLAVLPDLTTQEEDDGDVELSEKDLAARKAARVEQEKEACALALQAYVSRLREIIKNNQVSLARDLSRADYKYGPEHEMSDGELDAMKKVAKYDRKGKDADQERLNEIEALKKQITTK